VIKELEGRQFWGGRQLPAMNRNGEPRLGLTGWSSRNVCEGEIPSAFEEGLENWICGRRAKTWSGVAESRVRCRTVHKF